MPSLYSRPLCIVTLVICLGLVAGCAGAAETDPDGRLFQPSADPLADVQQALGRAGAMIHARWRRGCTARRWRN